MTSANLSLQRLRAQRQGKVNRLDRKLSATRNWSVVIKGNQSVLMAPKRAVRKKAQMEEATAELRRLVADLRSDFQVLRQQIVALELRVAELELPSPHRPPTP